MHVRPVLRNKMQEGQASNRKLIVKLARAPNTLGAREIVFCINMAADYISGSVVWWLAAALRAIARS